MRKLFTSALILLLVAACGQRAPATDTTELQARSDAFEAALSAGDIDTFVGIYAQDARVLPPGGKVSSGHDAVRATFAGMFEAKLGLDRTILEITVSDDVGYIVGVYVLQAKGEAVGSGKYIETWRRDDSGQWRISNDIFNDDAKSEPQ